MQTSGCTVRIKPVGVAEGDGAGTTAYSTDGIVYYTPTQAETNYTSFILIAKKTACIPVSITVVTSGSATAGHAAVDWGVVANKTTTNALTGTTIATTQKVDVETIKTNPVVNAGTATFPTNATLASTTNITAGTVTTATNVTTVSSGAISEASYDTTAGSFAPLGIVDQGTAQSASATGLVLRAAAAFADDTLIGATLFVFGSTQGYWQQRIITDNALSGDAVTVDTWTVTPSGTITYKIFATPPSITALPNVNVTQISGDSTAADTLELFVEALDQATGQLDSGSLAAGTITAGSIAADAIGASELAADAIAEIADAVWDEDATGHQTGGTFGQAIGDPGADTNTIFKAVVTDATGATVGVDVADILVDTSTTLQAELDGIQADTEDIQTRLPAALTGAGNMKADVLAINGSTTAASNQGKAALAVYQGSCTSTSTTTTIIDTALTQVNDHWNGRVVIFLTGTLAYQATAITDFTASSDTLTVVALTSAPQSGDTYVIV